MDDNRLVYYTEFGRMCPRCGKPSSRCICQKKKDRDTPSGYPDDGVVRIRRETRGRKGKTVTAVFGLPLQRDDLQRFAKTLKKHCGTGGSVKDGVLVFQGDHRDALKHEIEKQGYVVKLAGG